MASWLTLLIAFIVLLIAIAMKVVAKTSDSRTVFPLTVFGFFLVYILAALAITWLNPSLPGANVSSFSGLIDPSAGQDGSVIQETTAPPDVIIRQ